MQMKYGICSPYVVNNRKVKNLLDLRIHAQSVLCANGKAELYKNGEFFYGRRAFGHGDRIDFRMKLPRALGTVSAMVNIRNDYTGEKFSEKLSFFTIENDFDIYTCTLDAEALGCEYGLFFWFLTIESAVGEVYGIRGGEYDEIAFSQENRGMEFQFGISRFLHNPPEEMYGGIIYHIFVDRFFSSGKTTLRPDSVKIEDWDNGIPEYPAYPGAPIENNTFFGGDLWGVAEKLDYLLSLGVNCIYLSPVFEAYSNHKYDTGNYMKVDAEFGGEEALSHLIRECKKRKIKIILDGVFNHTGADSLYFNKFGKYDSIGAYQSRKSPYYSWYDFQHFPDKYTSWWGIDILPRINTSVKECGDYFVGKDGVIEHYAKMGIDGFRLDVVDELSDEFTAEIKSVLAKNTDNSVLYGEVWEDASNKIAYDVRKKYYMGAELDGVMNYPIRAGIIEYLRYKNDSKLRYALTEVYANSPKRIADAQMNLLGTHDTERIITALAADSAEGRSNDELAVYRMSDVQYGKGVRMLSCAYLILATVPGIPAVYYGDEAGLQGYKDPFNRMPFPWKKMCRELYEQYVKTGNFRRGAAIYRKGEFRLLYLDSDILIFSREHTGRAYVTVVNNSDRIAEFNFADGAKSVFGEKIRRNALRLAPISGAVITMKTSDTDKITVDFDPENKSGRNDAKRVRSAKKVKTKKG